MTGRKTGVGGRKPLGAAKTGGLGIKKLAVKVDDRLFEQTPKELEAGVAESAVAPELVGVARRAAVERAVQLQRRGVRRDPRGGRREARVPREAGEPRGVPGGFRSMSSKNDPSKQPVARSAKKMSSRNRASGRRNHLLGVLWRRRSGGANGDGRDMSQFNHAGSISSADYFGDGREDEFDITAGELMSKMSIQARQDVQHIKVLAAIRGAKVIGEFLNELK